MLAKRNGSIHERCSLEWGRKKISGNAANALMMRILRNSDHDLVAGSANYPKFKVPSKKCKLQVCLGNSTS